MESLPELKKIPHLNYRKDRGAYFTRIPIPEDLKEFYKTANGKSQAYVTRSISASTAKGIKQAHDSNVDEIRAEFKANRREGNRHLAKIEEHARTFVVNQKPVSEDRKRGRRRKSVGERLDEKLSKIAASCKISDSEISAYLSDWYEIVWAKARDRLQYVLRLKLEVSESMGDGGELIEQLSDIGAELHELLLGIDPSFPNESVTNEIHSVGYQVPDEIELKKIFVENSIRLKTGCPAYLKMRRLIKGIMIDLLKWQESSYEADEPRPFVSRSLDEVRQLRKQDTFKSPVSSTSITSSVTVAQLFERFQKHKKQNKEVGKSVWSEISLMRGLVVEMFGNRKISSISKEEIMKLKDLVSNMTSRKDRRFKNMPLIDAIKIGNDEGLPRLTNSTVNRYRQVLQDAFVFGAKSGWIEEETIAELKERFNDTKRKRNVSPKVDRESFTDSELSIIFSSPIFTGMRGKSSASYKGGEFVYWDHRYWGTLIALFTGMRPREIWQLRVSQIKEMDGIKYFDVKTEYEDQSIKTQSSGFRKAPIHSQLISLGFLDYIAERRADEYVLHSITKSKDKDLTGYLTSWFNATLLKKLGILGMPGQKVFYSFRHTFATTALRASINEGILDELCGWSSEERRALRKSMRVNYTKAGHGMELLKDAIEKIKYPSIDFSRMYPENFRQVDKFKFRKI